MNFLFAEYPSILVNIGKKCQPSLLDENVILNVDQEFQDWSAANDLCLNQNKTQIIEFSLSFDCWIYSVDDFVNSFTINN